MEHDFKKSLTKVINLTRFEQLAAQSFGVSIVALIISVFFGDLLGSSRTTVIAAMIPTAVLMIVLDIYLQKLLDRAASEHVARATKQSATTSHET